MKNIKELKLYKSKNIFKHLLRIADLCRKLNMDITKFKTKSMLINYLYTIDLNNVHLLAIFTFLIMLKNCTYIVF